MRVVVIVFLLCVLFAAPMGSESAQRESASRPKATAPAAANPPERLEEFVPSEKISADRAISFPTDI